MTKSEKYHIVHTTSPVRHESWMLINMANNFLISDFSFHFSFFHFSFLMLLRCPVRISTIDYVSVALTTAIRKPRYVPYCFLSLSFLRYSSSFFGSQYFRYSLWNFFFSLSFFFGSLQGSCLGSTNMTEIYGYVLREIKVCWTEF